jgi:hypothetical protein
VLIVGMTILNGNNAVVTAMFTPTAYVMCQLCPVLRKMCPMLLRL